MTPEEAKQFLANKLFPKKRSGLTEADFTAAWTALPSAGKLSIVQSAITGDTANTGSLIETMLNRYARDLAETRADEIAADGAISLAEFSEVFD